MAQHTLKFETEELNEKGKIGKHLEAKCSECGYEFYMVFADTEDADVGWMNKEFKRCLEKDKGYEMSCNDYIMWCFMGKPR